jgi:hypothetical protein
MDSKLKKRKEMSYVQQNNDYEWKSSVSEEASLLLRRTCPNGQKRYTKSFL